MENLNLLDNTGAAPVCSVCGEPLTAFGSKELRDGVLCRNCAKLLSEWLSDEELRDMRLTRIRRHLACREDNRNRLLNFCPDITVDAKYDLYIDTESKAFVISKRKDYAADNADVIRLSSIRRIRAFTGVAENGTDQDIMMELDIFYKQLRRISFRVNEFSGMEPGSEQFLAAKETAEQYIQAFLSAGVKERKVERDYGI